MEADPKTMNAFDLFALLWRNAKIMMRQTADLGSAEFNQIKRTLIFGSILIGIGLGALAMGTMALTAAAIMLLNLVLPLWASALIVALGLSGFGFTCALAGYFEIRVRGVVPRKSIAMIKENAKWLIDRW